MLNALLEDARENAEAHALLPDSELPLHARSPEWRWTKDTNAYGT